MSVTGPAANISAIQKLSEIELENGVIGESSWHNRYKDSCYIFIGGLDKRMTEGDVIIVFSQFGEPIDINLKRDKKTGTSLGYCFLGYRDQRSTILAVDNFNGYTLLGRRLRVDHVLDYKAPVEFDDELDDEGNKIPKEYKPTGAEGAGLDQYYVTESEYMLKDVSKNKGEERKESYKSLDDDERWALEFEESLKRGEVSDSTLELESSKANSGGREYIDVNEDNRRRRERHKRDRSKSREREYRRGCRYKDRS